MLKYDNQFVRLAKLLMMAPLHISGLVQDTECLNVPVMDGIVFDKGWRNQPESVRVEIRSAMGLQVQSVSIEFAAVFRGLRWLMYNYWFISFAVFTTAFWSVAMGSSVTVWLLVSTYMNSLSASRGIRDRPTKPMDESDTEATRRLDSDGDTTDQVKREDDGTTTGQSTTEHIGAEADDEDEEDDFLIDEPGMPSSSIGSSRVWVEDSGELLLLFSPAVLWLILTQALDLAVTRVRFHQVPPYHVVEISSKRATSDSRWLWIVHLH